MIGERKVYLDFTTDLSIDECAERLKAGPSQVIEHRLSARTDGKQFVIEAAHDRNFYGLGVGTTLYGSIKQETDRTRIRAYIKYRDPAMYVYSIIFFSFGCLF